MVYCPNDSPQSQLSVAFRVMFGSGVGKEAKRNVLQVDSEGQVDVDLDFSRSGSYIRRAATVALCTGAAQARLTLEFEICDNCFLHPPHDSSVNSRRSAYIRVYEEDIVYRSTTRQSQAGQPKL